MAAAGVPVRTDVELLVEVLCALDQGREPRIDMDERKRLRCLEHSLRVADQNAEGNAVTAELRRTGELVLLTR